MIRMRQFFLAISFFVHVCCEMTFGMNSSWHIKTWWNRSFCFYFGDVAMMSAILSLGVLHTCVISKSCLLQRLVSTSLLRILYKLMSLKTLLVIVTVIYLLYAVFAYFLQILVVLCSPSSVRVKTLAPIAGLS